MISINARKNMKFFEFLGCYFNLYSGFLLEPFRDLMTYRRTYKNFLQVIKKKRSGQYPIKAVLKDNSTVNLDNLFQVRMHHWGVKDNCKFKDNILIIEKKGFPKIELVDWEENGDLGAVFFEDEYKYLPVRNKLVVDIGANIGDSPIYFALRGAEKIVAIEPAPKNFEAAKKNVKLNNLEEKIELLQAGVGNKKGKIKVDTTKSGTRYSLQEEMSNILEVPLITLKDILDNTNADDCILKIDCEGCEYEILLSADPEILRRFSHIQLEYHYGYKNLQSKLEKNGFKIRKSKPKRGKQIHPNIPNTYVGYIYAERV